MHSPSPQATVFFSHGLESGPWGTKIKRLASTAESLGWAVRSVDYRGQRDPHLRVETLITAVSEAKVTEYVLAGSSMGGFVSARASQQLQPLGLFLIAPAVCLPDRPWSDIHPRACPTTVVHGWDDDVIPVESAIAFSRRAACNLVLMPGDHRLTGEPLERLDRDFARFLTDLRPTQASAG